MDKHVREVVANAARHARHARDVAAGDRSREQTASLLDRYLYAVRRHLPRGQQDDIIAELEDTLRSRIEEDEARVGRSLTEDEQGAILKAFGRPLAVAARYGTPEYLIGPELFPYYRVALRVLAYVAGPALFVAAAVAVMTSQRALVGVADAVGNALMGAFTVVGVVTLVFWRLQRMQVDFSGDWEPRELPTPPSPTKTVPTMVSLQGAVVMTAYLLWWIGALPIPRWIVGWNGADSPIFSAAWQPVSLAITVLVAVEYAVQWLNVLRPRETRWRVVVKILGDLGAMTVIAYLFRAGDLFIVTRPAWVDASAIINDVARWGLVTLGVLIAIGLIDEVKRLFAIDVKAIPTAPAAI